jgi:PAS domain S-box-containing protein
MAIISESAAALRRLAEEKAALSPQIPESLPPEEARQVLHELRVHQIELEMQNEELRRTQVELETSRARYFDLYDMAPVGYFTVSEEGLILEANLTAVTLLGVTRGELVKRPLSRFIHTLDQDLYSRHRKQLLATGEPQSCDLRLVPKDGSHFWARYEATAAQDADGAPVSRAVISDITGRKLAEEKLRRLNVELLSSNRDLEQFAYVASHDLQEPLRMVISFTQLLARRYEDKLDEKGLQFIAYAVDGATRMQRLIDDLLTFSRVGTKGLPTVPTDSRAIVDKALGNLQVALEESGAVVTVGDLPTVRADSIQLVQLFQNLVANAIKFSRSGEAPRIAISAENLGGEWRFAVRDSGIGIDPQYADKIFVIFQRLHTREEYPGTGIGLAVCKRIVERHGGRIWVESILGQGATFFFTVPPPGLNQEL